jgi:hypothetical protein
MTPNYCTCTRTFLLCSQTPRTGSWFPSNALSSGTSRRVCFSVCVHLLHVRFRVGFTAVLVIFVILLVKHYLLQYSLVEQIQDKPARWEPEVMRFENLHDFVEDGWPAKARHLSRLDAVAQMLVRHLCLRARVILTLASRLRLSSRVQCYPSPLQA